MATAFNVILEGFSAFERQTFESFFRLSARRVPGYNWIKERAGADFLVVDTDAGADLSVFSTPAFLHKVVFVGETPSGLNAPQLKRPIHFFGLLRVLDEMVSAQMQPVYTSSPAAGSASTQGTAPSAAAQPAAAAPSPGAIAAEQARARLASLKQATHSGFVATQPMSALHAREAFSAGVARPVQEIMGADDLRYDHILVVDDSPLAQRFMQSRLERFRFKVHLASSGDDAMRQVANREFYFVFLDVNMPGLDGYQTCKQIKTLSYPNGRRAPIVAMLTSRSGAIDKIRGTLAGCDAYLTKPLEEKELTDVISRFDDTFKRGFDSTTFKSSVQ
jgi:two-component system, cell cycle response regulator